MMKVHIKRTKKTKWEFMVILTKLYLALGRVTIICVYGIP